MANIFGKNLNQLMVETIDDLSSSANINNFSPGSMTRAILTTINRQTERMYTTFDINFARAFLSGARGKYLDYLGDMVGVQRLGSQTTSVAASNKNFRFFVDTGTFGDINNSQPISIPPNTQIKTHATATTSYITTSSNILPVNASEAFISVISTSAGSRGHINKGIMKYHDFRGYADATNNTLKVINNEGALTARDLESDINYKFRIANALLSAEKANSTALRLTALSVPGVANVIVTPRMFGIGTTDIIIQAVLPTVSTELVNTVKSAISDVEAYGTLVNVRGPKEYGIGLTMELTTRTKLDSNEQDQLSRTVDQAVLNYINRLNIAEPFQRNTVIQTVLTVSDKIKNVGTLTLPFRELSLFIPTALDDNKRREDLLDDFTPPIDGRVIVEPSLVDPIQVVFA